ncbi:MAG: tryptophan--tRNA ligase [Leptonema sp. (in: Bacteria)]|nr:tryptophan--tRNA ligase [Leptonema sp. (in: bacteria)]
MRVLSGIQPSGRPHLGNYFSMMKRMLEYQESSELFCFVASYHAMTTVEDGQLLSKNIEGIVLDFLALGMDPNRSTFWVQSDVPQVAELTWILSMHITQSQLELAHSFKDKTNQGFAPSAGLFLYPVLMAADILAFHSDRVPVGKDQKQHLEFTRDIARRFNNVYGDVFTIPEADISDEVALVPGIDGRKMSKSYHNTIDIFGSEKEVKKVVSSIVTDSKGVEEEKEPKGPLFDIYSLFLDKQGRDELANRFRTPGTGYGHIKMDLLKQILNSFGEARDRRLSLEKDMSLVYDILEQGAKKAMAIAEPLLDEVRSKTGLNYRK